MRIDKTYIITLIISLFIVTSSCSQPTNKRSDVVKPKSDIIVGAERMDKYLPMLKNRKVAIIANQTSVVNGVHLVDTLLSLGIDIKVIFSPEHGFRGTDDAGKHIKNGIDKKTGIPIISLYGKNKKPTTKQLADVDIIVFDIQDVGTRFYTYISTMAYAMEACAENNKEFLVLDRPNPNGFYVDGPVLEKEYASFVGLHQVPVVHGMTIAEYAHMINEEAWLNGAVKCNLKHIACKGYSHKYTYRLPVNPSPNLANMTAIYLYPSLCLFEGTVISLGRGTDKPFQIIGYPKLSKYEIKFTPKSREGSSAPPYENELCYGYDLTSYCDTILKYKKFDIYWLIKLYNDFPEKEIFFNNFFNNLAGNSGLKQQIIEGVKQEAIEQTWARDIAKFKLIRKKYLLYEDFE